MVPSVQNQSPAVQYPRDDFKEDIAWTFCSNNIVPRLSTVLISIVTVALTAVQLSMDTINSLKADSQSLRSDFLHGRISPLSFNTTSDALFDQGIDYENRLIKNAYAIIMCSVPLIILSMPYFSLRPYFSSRDEPEEDSKPIRRCFFVAGTAALGVGLWSSLTFPISGPFLAFSGVYTVCNSFKAKQWVSGYNRVASVCARLSCRSEVT